MAHQRDVAYLKSFIRDVFETMAMVNYPYPTNFLQPIPGWPVKVNDFNYEFYF